MGCCSGNVDCCSEITDDSLTNNMNTLIYRPSECINCGLCSIVCPHGVFTPGKSKAELANADACMECGACQLNCPIDAISVESGVGCAAAMIRAALTGRKEVSCGESDSSSCCKSSK